MTSRNSTYIYRAHPKEYYLPPPAAGYPLDRSERENIVSYERQSCTHGAQRAVPANRKKSPVAIAIALSNVSFARMPVEKNREGKAIVTIAAICILANWHRAQQIYIITMQL